MLQRNVGSVRWKIVEEGSERICAKMPVLHVIQRNVKGKTADILLTPVKCFWRLIMLINLHSSWFVLSKILCKCSAICNIYFCWFSVFFIIGSIIVLINLRKFLFSPLSSFLFGNFSLFLLYSHRYDNQASVSVRKICSHTLWWLLWYMWQSFTGQWVTQIKISLGNS